MNYLVIAIAAAAILISSMGSPKSAPKSAQKVFDQNGDFVGCRVLLPSGESVARISACGSRMDF